AIAVPVEFLQLGIALELADDPIAVERDVHAPADVVPATYFGRGQVQFLLQRRAALGWKLVEELEAAAEHPDRHDVGVGVVGETWFARPWVGVVVFVRSYHALNDVAPARAIVSGDTCPETCDFQQDLRPIEGHEL